MLNLNYSRSRFALAALVSGFVSLTLAPTAADEVCKSRAERCGKEWAFCDNPAFLAPLLGDECSSVQPNCPRPANCPVPEKSNCGEFWTEWSDLLSPVGAPCPAGCTPTENTGRETRTVSEFFKEQYREKWACTGTPSKRAKTVSK
ncbi:MAG TPA: hypothetical protein VK446_13910 [Methylocystis sp.]|nr:hypothetical protein [Methylocystis sp.]